MNTNTESNKYTILFAIGMVIVVGSLLAFTASSLKPNIKENERMEKQQNMLLGKIDAMEKRISGVITGETQTGKTVNGHGDVTDESIDASADKNDVIADIKLNTHSNDGQDFVSIDTSEKVIHNFRRVSSFKFILENSFKLLILFLASTSLVKYTLDSWQLAVGSWQLAVGS